MYGREVCWKATDKSRFERSIVRIGDWKRDRGSSLKNEPTPARRALAQPSLDRSKRGLRPQRFRIPLNFDTHTGWRLVSGVSDDRELEPLFAQSVTFHTTLRRPNRTGNDTHTQACRWTLRGASSFCLCRSPPPPPSALGSSRAPAPSRAPAQSDERETTTFPQRCFSRLYFSNLFFSLENRAHISLCGFFY